MAKFLIVTLFCTIALASISDSIRYDGYKVYRVNFTTDGQFNILRQMQMTLTHQSGIMLWQLSHRQHYAIIMLAPEKVKSFLSMLDSNHFTYSLLNDDVQKGINKGN